MTLLAMLENICQVAAHKPAAIDIFEVSGHSVGYVAGGDHLRYLTASDLVVDTPAAALA
jgi:hypothetical protein